MAEELSLATLPQMKKAEYIKAFKNKAVWKKAKAVIVMVDYKLDGKKAVIAIPFKKEAEMKAEMKRLKKEKLHLLKKTGGGTIEFMPSPEGMKAKIDLKIGGLAPELLIAKGQELFGRIKATIEALQSAEAAADAAAAEIEEDDEEEEEDAAVDTAETYEEETEEEERWEDENEKPPVASNENNSDDSPLADTKLTKINENIPKLEAFLSKGLSIKELETVSTKIAQYKAAIGEAKDSESVAIFAKLEQLTMVVADLPKAIELATKIKETLSKLQSN